MFTTSLPEGDTRLGKIVYSKNTATTKKFKAKP